MAERPAALPLILVTLWAAAPLWPEVARGHLLEARALALHLGLLCPAREHDVVLPDPRSLRRLLETAALDGELRGFADLSWMLEILVSDLTFAAARAA